MGDPLGLAHGRGPGRAVAPRLGMLSDAEQKLLSEWLDRAIDGL